MEIQQEIDNRCSISKTIKKVDASGLVLQEDSISIIGSSLDECFKYYKKVRVEK